MTVASLAREIGGPLRAAETAVIDRRVAGGGGVLLVYGPDGAGRSRLTRELVHRAERAGARVLRAGASRGRGAPFAPLLEAALGAEPPIGDLWTLRKLTAQPDTERVGVAHWVLHDLRSALRAAAANGPMVIVVDDLQWADADTAMAIGALAADLRDAGVLWVLAARRAEVSPVVGDLLTELEWGGAEVLRLG